MNCLHLALFTPRDPCSHVPCVGLRSLLINYRLLTTFPDAAQCFQRPSPVQGNSSARDAFIF